MNLLEVRYTIRNKEIIEVQTEEDFLQFVTELCCDTFEWTPLLEICEGIIFVHSETWENDFFSDKGLQEWKQNNIDIENESDSEFFSKIIAFLQIEVEIITSLD